MIAGVVIPGQPICRSDALCNGGAGVRFEIGVGPGQEPAFVVRYDGRVYAYLNRCAHRQVELDWVEGQFFDAEGRHLICATHGATYRPENGQCVAGPCGGARLTPVAVHEEAGEIRLAATSLDVVK